MLSVLLLFTEISFYCVYHRLHGLYFEYLFILILLPIIYGAYKIALRRINIKTSIESGKFIYLLNLLELIENIM